MADKDDARSFGDRGALRAPSRPKPLNRSSDEAVILGCQQAIQSSKALLLRTSEASIRTSPAAGGNCLGEDILQLFYSSRIPEAKSLKQKQNDLDDILRISRKKNLSLGITGVLVANERMYSQIIEGPRASIKDLMGRISCDVRHQDIRIISRDIAKRRIFFKWSMDFILTDKDIELQNTAIQTENDPDSSAILSFCSSIGIRTI